MPLLNRIVVRIDVQGDTDTNTENRCKSLFGRCQCLEKFENVFGVDKFLVLLDLERAVGPRSHLEEVCVLGGIVRTRSSLRIG